MRVPLLDQGMLLQRSMDLARLMPTSCFCKKIEGHFATWKKYSSGYVLKNIKNVHFMLKA